MSLWKNETNESPYTGDPEKSHPGPTALRSQSLDIDSPTKKFNIAWIKALKSKQNVNSNDNNKTSTDEATPAKRSMSLSSVPSSSPSSTLSVHEEKTNIGKNYIQRFGDYFLTPNKTLINVSTLGQNRSFNIDVPKLSIKTTSNTKIKSISSKSTVNTNLSENDETNQILCDTEKQIINTKKSSILSSTSISSSNASTSSSILSESNNAIENVNKNDKEILKNTSELNSFLLPRIVLKHNNNNNNNSNNSSNNSNNNNNVNNSNSNSKNSNNNTGSSNISQTNSNDDSGFGRSYDKTERQNRNNHNHQDDHEHHHISTSNYSTEKSGSSGYYGSNLYSTGSVDEHIYSEPVIEKTYDTKRSLTLASLQRHPMENLHADDAQLEFNKKKTLKLPTIMEGIDGQIPRPVWPSDFDDSLIDINLESFLLSNEQRQHLGNDGIINQAFDDDNDTEHENEKPIEEIIYSLGVQQTREILEEIRKKLNNLLEKSPSATTIASSNSSNSSKLQQPPNKDYQNDYQIISEKQLEQTQSSLDLQNEIKNLKQDLDEYIRIINKENEMEIKQLCDGLSKNTKMLTMKKALENNRTQKLNNLSNFRHDDNNIYEIFDQFELENGYELMKPKSQKSPSLSNYFDTSTEEISSTKLNFDKVYVRDGFSIKDYPNDRNSLLTVSRQTSIRSAEHPNFHFQRRSNTTTTTTNSYSISVDINSSDNNQSDNLSLNSIEKSSEEKSNLKSNLSIQNPILVNSLGKPILNNNKINNSGNKCDDRDLIMETHKNKPSIWELYYGSNRLTQTAPKKVRTGKGKTVQSILSYPSTRPESDFTLDLPRAEQLRVKMKKEKQFRYRCRLLTTFFSLIFFLITVMVVSLLLTRGKRMFGSML